MMTHLHPACAGGQNLQEVLGTVISGAVDFPDPSVSSVCGYLSLNLSYLFLSQVQKVCFGILKKLVENWG